MCFVRGYMFPLWIANNLWFNTRRHKLYILKSCYPILMWIRSFSHLIGCGQFNTFYALLFLIYLNNSVVCREIIKYFNSIDLYNIIIKKLLQNSCMAAVPGAWKKKKIKTRFIIFSSLISSPLIHRIGNPTSESRALIPSRFSTINIWVGARSLNRYMICEIY